MYRALIIPGLDGRSSGTSIDAKGAKGYLDDMAKEAYKMRMIPIVREPSELESVVSVTMELNTEDGSVSYIRHNPLAANGYEFQVHR